MLELQTVEDVTREPPLDEVYHPSNVYPVLVGTGSSPKALPSYILKDEGLTEPPLALIPSSEAVTETVPPFSRIHVLSRPSWP